jgi:hypothetical protein
MNNNLLVYTENELPDNIEILIKKGIKDSYEIDKFVDEDDKKFKFLFDDETNCDIFIERISNNEILISGFLAWQVIEIYSLVERIVNHED